MLFAFVTIIANAQISRYVKVSATGAGNGTSWADAAGTADIQTMIDQVAADVNRGTVYFAEGTYLLGATITLKDGVNLTGGYSADGNSRDLMLYKTILDGQDTRKIVTINGGDAALFTKSTVVDGFVIQRGKDDYGSAVVMGFRVLLRNCLIRNNREANTGGGYGTVYIKATNASATFNGCLANCIIVNNTSSRAIVFTDGASKTFSIVNCVIANNQINAMSTFNKAFNSNGIRLGDYTHYTQIINNILWNNAGPAYSLPIRISNGTIQDTKNNIIEKQRDSISNNINATLTNYYSAPTFANPTTFVGRATSQAQIDEINSSDWRLKNGSQGINIGYSGQLKDRATITGTTEVLKNYIDYLSTDFQGSSRFISTSPEMGAYEFNPVVVTTASADVNQGTVSANVTVSKGSTATVTATPASGYKFTKWNNGTSDVSTSASYSFVPMADLTLTATFEVDLGTGMNNVAANRFVMVNNKQLTVAEAGRLQVFNVSGKLVVDKCIVGETVSVENSGVYFVKLRTEKGIKVQKVLVN